ncbi:MAG: hypothetical protein LBE04_08260 [Prevotellaceae bacterium]|nr:hypothetical protein [Prevotellaceae bacterium]
MFYLNSCDTGQKTLFTGAEGEVKLITLDPGHFHAALVQKNMYRQVDPAIFVYAPDRNDLNDHLDKIESYKSNLIIRQGAEQNYKPSLYIEPQINDTAFESALNNQFDKVQAKYPGIELNKNGKGWEVQIPDKYRNGHEAHFGQVTERFLQYLIDNKLPEWEVPNMIAKYYTTTQAFKIANDNN